MTPQRVTLITLGVADITRAKAFYAALGWTPTREIEGQVVFYQMHGSALGFFSREALAKEQNRPVSALGTGAITLAQNMNSPEDVDEAYNKAIAAGATPLAAPAEMAWGGYSSYYADPDGHVWETAYNPYWELGDDGSLTLEAN
ncbi:VOC family protein [Yoonia litorea]|uniref:VOC domain-containing protein n=1 Tax=Yoonia litorea TaxID=1123755 RepID=A0A1I6MTV7_9RHOB|nr:VOC family protein [Yoonia litorea]SFS19125.1 hypothetical protein SAMN05444714_2102 [Yoonia litorea]